MSDVKNFEIWKWLLTTSLLIEENVKDGNVESEYLLEKLETIEAVFGQVADPANDFQSYVLLSLCRSFKRSILKMC
jgi:hypothetical protein